MTEGVIYRYKSPSGKYYIGQTIDEEGRRHAFLYSRTFGYAGNRINEARKKYGPENFEYTVLMKVEGDDPDEVRKYLNILECFFIKKYDSYHNGYNMSEGGHNMTEEARLKMIESRKGQTPWNKGKKGVQKGFWTGKTRNKETNDKISKSLTGKQLSEEHRKHIGEGHKGKHWKIVDGKRIYY